MILKRHTQAWRQWLVVLTLVSSDILLASLLWGLAYRLRSGTDHRMLAFIDREQVKYSCST